MKKVVLFMTIIVLCLSGCKFKSHKLTEAAPKKVAIKTIVPAISTEKRAGKFALFIKGNLSSSFDYDSINISRAYPVLIKGQKKYIFLQEKMVGPFDEIKVIDEKTIKISTDNHKKNGYLFPNGEKELFDHPVVERDSKEKDLYWVTTKSGQKGLISTKFSERQELLTLPFDEYLYVDAKTTYYDYGGHNYDILNVKYFKKNAFGKADAVREGGEYGYKLKETKLKDLFGYNAEVIAINKAKNALVNSEKGYGLISLDGAILVPAAYTGYQKIGDSAYVFSTANETLKVDLKGKKI